MSAGTPRRPAGDVAVSTPATASVGHPVTMPGDDARTIVVDRVLHRRLRGDMLLDLALHARWPRAALPGVLLLGLLVGRPLAGAALALVGAVGWALVHWVRIGRSLREGLGVGQRVTVAHADTGEPAVVVTDETGEVSLGRGSALVVTRFRGVVSFHGRQLSFVLPTELVTDAEAAFLEGRAARPDGPADDDVPPSDLAGSLTVTEQVQRAVTDAVSRAVLTSADMLFPLVAGVGVLAVGAASGARPILVLGGVMVAWYVLAAVRTAARVRRGIRAAYSVGRTVHAEVDADALTTQLGAVVHRVHWSTYDARRVSDGAVVLRRRGRSFSPAVFEVLPRGLFDDAAIGHLSGAVRRTF